MRVALLTSDTREVIRDYGATVPTFGTAPQALLEGFALLPDKVEVHVISCLQSKPASSPKKLAENIYYHGLHVPNIGWLKTGYLGCIRAVRNKLQEIQPDIVHGQGTERDCAMCAVWSGFPNVVTIHGVMSSICEVTKAKPLSYYWFAKHLETVALRRTRGVIAISAYVDRLVSVRTPQTWIIPNALRLPFIVPHLSKPREQTFPRLINVGVINPNKRQLELLEAFMNLREEVDFSVIFVGKADRRNVYDQRFLHSLRTANTIHGGFEHRDFASAEELAELYDSSDALIHFSREESFGLIFAEALARNLPVFASDVGAIRQISKDIPHCHVFKPNDFRHLTSSLAQWIKTGKHLETRAQVPNGAIASRYHPHVVGKQHLHVYQSVIKAAAR